MRRPLVQTALAAALLSVPQSGAAQTASPPRVLLACAPCHGFDGIGRESDIPNLAGQRREYLHNQLTAFGTGQRRHPEMNFFSGHMTKEEMRQVADYYSALPAR
jgi:cytochrome c553